MKSLDQLFDIKGKVVVVTGATGQLGRTFMGALGTLGAKTFGIDTNVQNPEVPAAGYFKADMSVKEEVKAALEEIFKTEKKVDLLVNNAGVSVFEPFEQRTDEKFDWVMDVNIKGVFNCIQSYVNLYDQHQCKQGAIVNIGSHYGVISPDFRIYGKGDRRNSEVYGASKAAVIQMTKYFAVHLADRNIRVNCVSPGGIFNPRTPQSEGFQRNYEERVPMKRMGNQEEMVGAIVYLASAAASYTTGQNLVIDGGMTCW
jgi:NAD(P)-dependent dehydrogenase (short-subunit alcohol dehydrogenase family)